MEGEREEWGKSTHSGTTSSQVDTLNQNLGAESNEPQKLLEPEEDQDDSAVSDGQETLKASDTQNSADCLPWSPPSESSHPSNTHNRAAEPCWYCQRSLECRPETPQQKDSDPLSPLPSSGHKTNYQTDPRPHFGVAWSSHSTCRPLWGSEGPCRVQRKQGMSNQTHTCPHCHLGMDPDALRWHEAKCLLFDGIRNSK